MSNPRPPLACSLALAVSIALASAASAGISDNVKTETLPNGLKVLVLENHKAPVATFQIFYRVGSRNEQTGKTGLAHLLEHLMFRGTKKYKPEEIDQIIQQNGGDLNAETSEDFTVYFENINKDHLDVPISLEADRMANFDPKGFDSGEAPWSRKSAGCAPRTIPPMRSTSLPRAGLHRASVSLADGGLDA